jgi:hypothetical protein
MLRFAAHCVGVVGALQELRRAIKNLVSLGESKTG